MTKLHKTTGILSSDNWRQSELFVSYFQLDVECRNKQTNFDYKSGEDLNYFVILRCKLRDFTKIYDDYVNVPI